MSIEIDSSNPDHLKIRFILPDNLADGPISVVGSFNDWVPGLDELTPNVGGTLSVTVGVPYGVDLVFRYLGPDGAWFDEPGADEITSRGSVLKAIPKWPDAEPG